MYFSFLFFNKKKSATRQTHPKKSNMHKKNIYNIIKSLFVLSDSMLYEAWDFYFVYYR